jgi:dGTPase
MKCVEAQIMDFADDVAYSVHDFEDSIVEGFVDPALISDSRSNDSLIEDISKWSEGSYSKSELQEALLSLRSSSHWLKTFDGSPRHLASLKNLASDLIGSFVSRTTSAVLEESKKGSLSRFSRGVMVPSRVKSQIAVLKGIVASSVMTENSRQPYYEDQRTLLVELAESLLAKNGAGLDSTGSEAWLAAKDHKAQKRVIVDFVASLTDPAAVALHRSTRA